MRGTIVAITIIALVFLPACGKKRQEQMPPLDEELIQDNQNQVGEQPSTDITEEEDVNADTGVGLGDEEVSERPLTKMTIEEINAAEFLKVIHFDFNLYALRDDAIAMLEQNGRWLMEHPTVRIIIEGHCDERGTEEYNLALGERRSNSARNFFIRYGISGDRLMTVSYGESRPLDPNQSELAWASNRRAQFRIYER